MGRSAPSGPRGAAHLLHILREGMLAQLARMGILRPSEAAGRLFPGSRGNARGVSDFAASPHRLV
jgi:hypothetical protein